MLTGSRTCRPAGALRLTTRGRVLAIVLMLAVAFAALASIRDISGQADAGGSARVVVVHRGDTLWSLATRAAPSSDPRVVVAKIKILNHLATSDVQPGEQLLLPV